MNPRIRRLIVSGVLLALVALVLIAGVAAADEPTPAGTQLAFRITDPRVTESSGLARDTDNTVFWTANDSGDSGVVYAIGPTGRTVGTLEFDAEPIDVEALAYADGRLYVADIGDNTGSRDSVRIYVFNNPAPGQERGSNYTAYDFVYPEGAQDAEAILVDDDGGIHIVTKAATGTVYRAPRQLSAGQVNRLTPVADAPAYVTDGTVLPSGRYALRTYLSVEILEPELYAPVARGALPFQRQGESMTLSLGDDALLVGTEGPSAPVLRVPFPTELAAAPTGAPTPPPSPSPSPTPVSGDTGGTNRTGTLVALGLAVLASIGAGLVVFFRDRDTDLEKRPEWKPRRLRDAITPGRDGTETDPDEREDHDRTVLRRPAAADEWDRAYQPEIWDLTLPDEDGPTELRR